MIQFSETVLSYTRGMSKSGFTSDKRTYDAALRNIELTGETATHFPQEVRAACPGIAWRRIVATRNRVAHGYMGIDRDIAWDIIQVEIPELLPRLRRLACAN